MTDYEELDAQLRAWFADDAAIAQAAAGLQDDPEHGWGFVPRDDYSRGGGTITPHIGSLWEYESVAHVTRFHPATVLADIAGKRSLLDALAENIKGYEHDDCGWSAANTAWEAALTCLAAAYEGRPEFKPEWRIDV